ncbi:DEAD/DEAH box helicase [Alkalicoccobacillus murimartini]|uniref:SNF2 family DNA or RNA helicase n=1 Tax=Alkalicoccobacillus murimartini TaxID=171685 RepID=A0ABT9YKA7_9BACI|nr:DEAD/DEAH box helicase [Alkalicoccobacillus murimartini]MDQ0207946.1 SNF2 family DNA or RNA helicase [Alkalicoccobacillus murimartini]
MRKMIIHGGWINKNLFVWAEQVKKSRFDQVDSFKYPFLYSPFELKLLLYQYDPHSFYGTFIQTGQAILQVPLINRQVQSPAGEATIYQADAQTKHYPFPVEGIQLTPDEFVWQLPLIKRWAELPHVEVGADLRVWIQLADEVWSIIEDGHFQPAADGSWRLKEDVIPLEAWTSSVPKASLSLQSEQSMAKQEQTKAENESHVLDTLNLISDAAIRLLIQDPEVNEAFSEWKNSVGDQWKSLVQSLASSSQNTQIPQTSNRLEQELGTVKLAPFQTALRIEEPNDSADPWIVKLCLADRVHSSYIVDMVDLEKGEHPWRVNPISQLKSDAKAISRAVPYLNEIGLSHAQVELSAEDVFSLCTAYDQQLRDIDIHLIVPNWLRQRKQMSVNLAVETPTQDSAYSEPLLNWENVADFTYNIAIGDVVLSADDFSQYVEEKRPFIYQNGQWVAWDPSMAKKLQTYLNQLENKATYLDTLLLNEGEDDQDQLELDVEWDVEWQSEMKTSLTQVYQEKPSLIELPETFNGELRAYQHEGVSWLAHLRRAGFGAVLADDMGLGKSIQTLVYMQYVKEAQEKANEVAEPFLLICPTSLLYNWSHEANQFASNLRVFIHHGQTRITQFLDNEELSQWDVVLTSYQLAVRDAEAFKTIHWNGMVLDEAQHIKNVDTKQRRVIKQFKATHIFALTGTPIENRLRELWSLMDVTNPGLLGRYGSFQNQFIKRIEKEKDQERLQQLQATIRPFVMRRKKNDLSLQLNLPEKRERIHHVHLSLEQAAYYQAIVEEVTKQLHEVSNMERRSLILRSLTRLKQICNHPAHFLKSKEMEAHESGKWNEFLRIIDEIQGKGEKVLIFTQYKEMGALITQELEKRFDHPVPFLHGSLTRAMRQAVISDFQSNDETTAFVLSLKAGGVGLNLTAATHVIHYDRWWNPAVENQATDRAFRIGQTSDVTVHKLITTGTVEERIDRMLVTKQSLADEILSADAAKLTEMTDDEVLDLIRLTRE